MDAARRDLTLPSRQPSGAPTPAVAPNRWQVLRSRLHGKARWIVLAALIGLLAGLMLGWTSTRPQYQAKLTLEVQPVVADAQSSTAQTAYHAFVERQLELLRQQHPADRFHVAADAVIPTTIRLTVIHDDSTAAAEDLAAMVAAYQQTPAFIDQRERATELQERIEARQTLYRHLLAARQQRQKAVAEIGTLAPDDVLRTRAEELGKIDLQLTEANIALATLQAADDGASTDPAQRYAQLARSDSTLAALLMQQQELDNRYQAMHHRMGENAPAMVALRAERQSLAQQIEQRAQQATAARVKLTGLGIEGTVALTMDDLLQRRRTLSQMREQVAAEHARLVQQKKEITRLDDAVAYAEAHLEQLDLEAQQLLAGGRAAGRVIVPDTLTPATVLHSDARWLHATLGGLIGLALVAGLTLSVLLADQRILRADAAQLAAGSAPLLGRVPAMGDRQGAATPSDAAALCIHEIRALLEIRAAASNAKAFAITSPAKGAGKTSLTVGLASSMALSGTRTLLVDLELTGRNTSTPTPRPQQTNKPHAAESRQSLDEVMMLMGYLDEQDTDIFLLPEDAKVGLVAMLEGAPLETCVIETSVPNLAILPAAGVTARHIGKLSCHFIRNLIAQARRQYDMILFDTGPIPGSVEALFVAGEADEVILVVSRGETQSRVDKTLAQLQMIGARLAGTVFNRDTTHHAAEDANAEANTTTSRPFNQNVGSGIFAAAVHAQANTTAFTNRKRDETPPPAEPAHTTDDVTPAKREEAIAPTTPPAPASTHSSPPPAPTIEAAADDEDDAITPEDAGEVYRMLLAEEIDLDARQTPGRSPTPSNVHNTAGSNGHVPPQADTTATDHAGAEAAARDIDADTQADDDMLDDLLDDVIASAKRSHSDHHRDE